MSIYHITKLQYYNYVEKKASSYKYAASTPIFRKKHLNTFSIIFQNNLHKFNDFRYYLNSLNLCVHCAKNFIKTNNLNNIIEVNAWNCKNRSIEDSYKYYNSDRCTNCKKIFNYDYNKLYKIDTGSAIILELLNTNIFTEREYFILFKLLNSNNILLGDVLKKIKLNVIKKHMIPDFRKNKIKHLI